MALAGCAQAELSRQQINGGIEASVGTLPLSGLLQHCLASLPMALLLQQQREGQQGPWVGRFFFSQLAIELLSGLRGSALA